MASGICSHDHGAGRTQASSFCDLGRTRLGSSRFRVTTKHHQASWVRFQSGKSIVCIGQSRRPRQERGQERGQESGGDKKADTAHLRSYFLGGFLNTLKTKPKSKKPVLNQRKGVRGKAALVQHLPYSGASAQSFSSICLANICYTRLT